MSRKYTASKDVPNEVLADRLDELATAVTKGRDGISEFTMRIPAECDRDADLVLCEAARRLRENTKAPEMLELLEEFVSCNSNAVSDRAQSLLNEIREESKGEE